jgi:nitrogen fixation/metabolism regulation signal transduction histidine kinase
MPPSAAYSRSLLDRRALTRGLGLLALVLLILAILGGMIWRNLQRLDTVQAYVAYSHQIQQTGLDLQYLLVELLSGETRSEPHYVQHVAEQLRNLAKGDAHFLPDTPGRLLQVEESLLHAARSTDDSGQTELFKAIRTMHAVLDAETDRREAELEGISRDTLAELELATGTLLVIMLLTALFVRSRILNPLNDLKRLLLNLAKEDYSPIETRRIDPLLLPVFNSYNLMVVHLAELEETKRLHARSLQAEVRAATEALLEQQRSLATAERLAAVGELAASLAHELRNPLAGIQMSCANLREEIADPEQGQRLDLIGSELHRMARLLNELLEQGKQTPVPATEFDLADLVRELLSLTRYQIPAHIRLEQHIPADLQCRLPEPSLRQALLNLILNASQALDERHGRITVSARREESRLHLEVADDGPGFSAEMLAGGIRTFASGRARGTGLGLAMVQRFVREWGGRINLSNREPSGARVELILPIQEPSP